MVEYFQHDFYARKDPKISALLKKFGYEGLGIYWSLVEILHEQKGKLKKFPALLTGIANDLSINEALLQSIISASIKEFWLLKENDTDIWSDRVISNLGKRETERLKKVNAGRKGGKISGQIRNEKRSKTKQCLKHGEANEAKEIKLKEIKGKEKKIINIFAEPSPSDVSDYAKTIDFEVDGQAFIDSYKKVGWVDKNGNKIKDWRACVRTWKRFSKKGFGQPKDSRGDGGYEFKA